jgi:hypothetical protein
MRATVAGSVWLALALLVPNQPNAPSSAPLAANAAEAFVRFEENKGQVAAAVDFMARLSGSTVFLTEGDAVFVLPPTRESRSARESTALRLEFVGTNAKAEPIGEGELASRSHYLIGRDPAQWHTDIPHVERVRYRNLYPGIDLLYRGGRALEFDVIVQPSADPSPIQFRLTGAERVERDDDGRLVASLATGRVVLEPPQVYQEVDGVRRTVEGRFRLAGNDVRFEIGNYDPSQTLTIDPLVIFYSSYVGGSGSEAAGGLAVDSQGMMYVTGQTLSSDFPVQGALQATPVSNEDAYVLKVNPGASGAASLIYATYLGSTGRDAAFDIAVDELGQAYVTGVTHEGDFPVTSNGFKPTFTPNPSPNDDESDAFAVILNASGNALVYGTFFGGTSDEEGMGIVPRTADTFYLAGGTDGVSFPTTTSAFDATGQVRSAFLSVLNWQTNTLTYSTVYHADPNIQLQVRALALDGSGRAHITGLARGAGLPVVNAFMPTFPPDATNNFGQLGSFLAVFDPSQTGSASLVYATYLGAGDAEDVATDSAGRSVVVGSTSSPSFATTTGAFDTVCEDLVTSSGQNLGCQRDAFVMVIDPAASGMASLARATRLGGVRSENGNGVAVDRDDNVVVTGSTSSAGFPAVDPIAGLTQRPDGEQDAFVTKLAPTLGTLVFSTRFGGVTTSTGASGASDSGLAVTLAPDGGVCVTGETRARDFPTARAFDTTLGGSNDAFAMKIGQPRRCFDLRIPVAPVDVPFVWEPPDEICVNRPIDPRGFPEPCPPPECPRCGPGLSPDVSIGEMPVTLAQLYRETGPLLASGGLRSPRARRDAYQPLLRAMRRAPEGRYFTAAEKQKLVRRLESQDQSRLGQAQLRRQITEALNAMELDWRTGSVAQPSANVGQTPTATIGEFRAVKALPAEGGAATLELRPGIPARPRGVSIGWPLVTYQVTASGTRSASRAEVELYVGWMAFRGAGEPRLLAWNGKDYQDVTTTYDAARGIVRGFVPFKVPLVVVKVPCTPGS